VRIAEIIGAAVLLDAISVTTTSAVGQEEIKDAEIFNLMETISGTPGSFMNGAPDTNPHRFTRLFEQIGGMKAANTTPYLASAELGFGTIKGGGLND